VGNGVEEEEEENCICQPNTCVGLLWKNSNEKLALSKEFSMAWFLVERQNLDTLNTRSCGKIRVWSVERLILMN